MNPVETRTTIESFISRSLFGPSQSDDNVWLGFSQPTNVATDGFTCDQVRPIGPWVNEANEEVLSTPPYFVYGVGVLFPKVSAKVQAEIDAQAESAIQESIGAENISTELREDQPQTSDDIFAEADADDEALVSESVTKPRSMAISIRLPNEINDIQVEVTAGLYSRLPITGQTRPWWSRSSLKWNLQLGVASSSESSNQIGAVKVSLGTTVRDFDEVSKIVTVWLRNDTTAIDKFEFNEKCMFQAKLEIETPQLLPYDNVTKSNISSLDLLYRNNLRWAAGHGTDARAQQIEGVWKVETCALPLVKVNGLTPDISFKVGMIDLASFNSTAQAGVDALIEAYGIWIKELENKAKAVDSKFSEIAESHVSACRNFLSRINQGWDLVRADDEVQSAFRDMSSAMNKQRIAYNSPLRESVSTQSGEILVSGSNPHIGNSSEQSYWRAFQIAFILASLPDVVSKKSDYPSPVDVIWMPTGGGKTEAYLGLAGFVILWERLQGNKTASESGMRPNTKVFMRYTLRLLTSQQLTRAASLICALELIRRSKPDAYGKRVIRIGAWLGSATSPNTHKSATILYSRILEGTANGNSFMLTRCPWCGAQMGQKSGDLSIVGYRKVDHPNPKLRTKRVMAACPAADCEFVFRENRGAQNNTYDGIPVLEVDEDIYLAPPDFVVGTIDKVARLAWVPDAQTLFGLKNGSRVAPPPTLFIQDELHLIAGPLGSIDGVFEALLEFLCVSHGGYFPKIVASTATTKNFEGQLERLYSRGGGLIPPPGIDIDDSFFAVLDVSDPGKDYLAVCPSGYGGSLNAQTRTLAVLSHAAGALNNVKIDTDPWWTNVVFFSSRRSLGQLHSQIETGFKGVMANLRELSGASSGASRLNTDGDETVGPTRYVRNLKQLTSTSSDNLNQVLDDLSISTASGNHNLIDMCFATSMIEVGLDVPRLGLMTVIGQPKSASQYIQVSGRVGRGKSSPALIVTFLSPHNVRDRSHYENFTDWHQRLYASVENSSVTPFTSRALERSVPTVMAALLRIFGNPKFVQKSVEEFWSSAVGVLRNRINSENEHEFAVLNAIIEELHRLITSKQALTAVWDYSYGENNFFLYGAADVIPAERLSTPYWRALNSMRSVEGDAGFLMNQKVSAGSASTPEGHELESDFEL